MKKIAYITSLPTPYRTPLLARIAKNPDIDLKVFYCSASAPSREWELTLGETAHFSEILPGKTIHVPFINIESKINSSVLRKLKEGKFDCLIIGGYNHLTMIIAIFWAVLNKVPYLLSSESHLLNKRKPWKNLLKSLFVGLIVRKASAYLPTGKFAGEYFINYGAETNRIFYFPNTPDVQFFLDETNKYREKKNSIKEELEIPNKIIIFFSGRLIKVKGVFTLLKAFKIVKEEFKNVSLLLAGNGILREELENFVTGNKIDDVLFAGFTKPEILPKYYAIADIFVLPSNHEPWGVVVNEAMASGLPIVLSDKVGARGDLLEEEKNGFCFESGNYRELARVFKLMLSNPEKLIEMGKRSKEIIKKHDYSYCEENLKKALELIFNRAHTKEK